MPHLARLIPSLLALALWAWSAASGQMVMKTDAGTTDEPRADGAAPAHAPGELVWPAPPEQPRIRWAGALASERQLGRKPSFFARLKRSIAGVSISGMYAVSRPYDVTALDSMRVYLTDGVTPAVIVFDRTTRKVEFLGADAAGGLSKPMGLGHDDRGYVYVADQAARRVVVFDERGHYARAFGGRELLVNPVDVAPDRAANRYYVVDSYLHQVVVFDSAGAVVARLGRNTGPVDTASATAPGAHDEIAASGDTLHPAGPPASHRARGRDVLDNRGAQPSEFRYPVSAAVGPDGTLWVADQLNFRVQAFDRAGGFLRSFGGMGTTPGSLARPKGIGVDSEGHVYVVDAAFNNIQVFDPEGRLLLVLGGGGPNPGELQLPIGLAVDRNDRMYVADRYNNRLAMYQYLGTPPTDPAYAPRAP
jgi:DNA-binding beta-propeller fold protein YncE